MLWKKFLDTKKAVEKKIDSMIQIRDSYVVEKNSEVEFYFHLIDQITSTVFKLDDMEKHLDRRKNEYFDENDLKILQYYRDVLSLL